MDATSTQTAYRPLPRLETDRPRAFFIQALEALVVPAVCLGLAAGAFVMTYCWMLHR